MMSERRPLTDRQRHALAVIVDSVRERGYPPTIKEISEALDIRSTSTAWRHVCALVDKGYITVEPTKPRAITILEEAS